MASASADALDANIVVEIADVRLYRVADERKSLVSTSTLTMIVSSAPVAAASAASAAAAAEVYLLILDRFQIAAAPSTIALAVSRTEYLFPGVGEHTYGVALPAHVDAELAELLEQVLRDQCTFRRAPHAALAALPDAPDEWAALGASVAAHVDEGARLVAAGIRHVSAWAGQGIHAGSDFIISRTDKAPPPPASSSSSSLSSSPITTTAAASAAASSSPSPSSPPATLVARVSHEVSAASSAVRAHVDASMHSLAAPETRARLANARFAAGVSVKVSKALVAGATATALHLSSHLTDAVLRTDAGQRLGAASSSPRTQAAKQLAVASIGAVVTVAGAVADSALQLLGDTTSATANVVEHRYGADVGAAARDGLGAVTLVGEAALQMRQVGVGIIAAKAAANTAVTVLSSEQERVQAHNAAPAVDPALQLGAMMLVQSAMSAQQQQSSSSSAAPGHK